MKLDALEGQNWHCPKDNKYYQKIVGKEWVHKFLLGLNKNLIKGRILSTKPLPSVKETFSKVRMEESQRKVMLGNQNSQNIEGVALVS